MLHPHPTSPKNPPRRELHPALPAALAGKQEIPAAQSGRRKRKEVVQGKCPRSRSLAKPGAKPGARPEPCRSHARSRGLLHTCVLLQHQCPITPLEMFPKRKCSYALSLCKCAGTSWTCGCVLPPAPPSEAAAPGPSPPRLHRMPWGGDMGLVQPMHGFDSRASKIAQALVNLLNQAQTRSPSPKSTGRVGPLSHGALFTPVGDNGLLVVIATASVAPIFLNHVVIGCLHVHLPASSGKLSPPGNP